MCQGPCLPCQKHENNHVLFYFFKVWFKNRRAKCRQIAAQSKEASASTGSGNASGAGSGAAGKTQTPTSGANKPVKQLGNNGTGNTNPRTTIAGSTTAIPNCETSPASSMASGDHPDIGPGGGAGGGHFGGGQTGLGSGAGGLGCLPPPPPLILQPQQLNSSSLNNHDLGGHHTDPYGDASNTTGSPYQNHFWTPQNNGTGGGGATGNGGGVNIKYENGVSNLDLNNRHSPVTSSQTSLVMQVKASNVSPPMGSPHSPAPMGSAQAAAAAAAAAASHPMAVHQSYPTYHHHPNPYYPVNPADLAYFGGQQYNMATNSAAAMFRSDAYDAYQQAASREGHYHQLL